MSNIDEGKLIDAMIAIAEASRQTSEISLKLNKRITDILGGFSAVEVGTLNAPTPEPDLEIGDDKPIFPDALANLVNITPSGPVWIVKPTKFLGAENFAMIANIVKQYGGKYNKSIGKGQSGYFEIPKESKP